MRRYGRWARRGTKGFLPWLVASAFLFALVTSGAGAAVGTTFTVDTTDGTTDGTCAGASDCSFGDAITEANSRPDKDTIAFDIPGTGPHLIVLPALPASFPTLTDAVVIDGQTQPSYAGTPLVEIDAGGQGPFGLLVIGDDSAGTEVRGIAIYGGNSGTDYAIEFDNRGGNIVERNFIGTDASGTIVKGRGGVAFGWIGTGDGFVSSDNRIVDNVIAGTTAAAVVLDEASDNQVLRNLIGTDPSGRVGLSGGLGTGIELRGSRNLLANNLIAAKNEGITIRSSTVSTSSDNRIEGNKIGTDITGAVDLGNSTWGIAVFDNVSGTLIGGADPPLRNVISGNDGAGISLTRAAGTVVHGNLIGTDGTGTGDRGNGGAGVSVGQTTGLTVIRDNVISGNDGPGITGGATAGGSLHIESNLIGTNEEGTAAVSNGGDGIVASGLDGEAVIGGESESQRNVISGNLGDGVSTNVDRIAVLNNYIGTNGDGEGESGLGNGGNGISIFGTGGIVGRPGAGNLISGNGRHGVLLGSESTLVQGNRIGTNAQGTAPLGNGGTGITTTCCYRDIRIGGGASGEGNLVSGNGAWGIDFLGSGAGNALVVVEGNRIGTNDAGTARIANGAGGVHIENANAFLKLLSNVVSGNSGDGVDVEAVGFDTTELFGNRIGTNDAGTAAIPNTQNGVKLGRASLGGKIFVGGLPASQRNIISGNGANGIVVANGGHTIVGNFVGIDRDGTNAVPNTLSGLRVQVAPNEVHDNVFSGNGQDGVELVSGAQTLTRNLVGTAADGSSRLGNSRHGVSIEGPGGTQHTIGGQAGDGNTIEFNGGHGVFIHRAHGNLVKQNTIFSNRGDGVAIVGVPPFGAIGNTISENSIYSNDGLGIDLQDDGVTANDLGDADGGSASAGLANLLQNFPVNLQVSADGTSVTGTLNSRPNTTYRVELFGNGVNVACDPTGNGEGERFLTAKDDVVTNGSGNASFFLQLDAALPAGESVSATATDLGGGLTGNTSEFSQCTRPPEPGTLVVRKVTVPSPDPSDTSFAFTAGGGLTPTGFSLKNGESRTFADVAAKAGYSVAEIAPAPGWDLTSSCDDGSPVSNIDIGPGETVTCTFTNTRLNRPPDAVDDSLSTAEGTPGSVDVLANDTDPDGDSLTVTEDTPGLKGSVTCTAAGSCTYTPSVGFSGSDSFTYTISDGRGGTDTATVSVTVTHVNLPPDAVDDSLTTAEDAAGSVDVLANDTDPDGDALTVTDWTNGAHGAVTCMAGACTYTPAANYHGPDSFTYTISDGHGGSDTATVRVTVTPVNDPPDAVDDALVTAANTPASVNVLANDTDPDGDALTVTASTQGLKGTVSCTAAGSCTYTPQLGFSGSDAFTYSISDGNGGSDTAAVAVTVTAPPVDPPPVCTIVAQGKDAAGKAFVRFRVQDTGSGLSHYKVVVLYRTTLLVDPFAIGTTTPVFATATATSKNGLAVTVDFFDVAGNKVTCDPIALVVAREDDQPEDQTFTNVPDTDRYVTIVNGTPGMRKVKLTVNNVKFKERDLAPGETRSFDIASALKPGPVNTITVSARGKKGASAFIIIADRPPSAG